MRPFDVFAWVLWVLAAALIVALGLRFAMRALGVRQDIAFPGLVYSLTAPLVEPFYRFFAASERFDYPAVEVASLLAAGVVIGVALAIYVAVLLATAWRSGPGD